MQKITVLLAATAFVIAGGVALWPRPHPAKAPPAQKQLTRQQEACAVEVTKAHVAARVALGNKEGQNIGAMLSVENTLAERRMNEDYCVRFAACLSDPKVEGALSRVALGATFRSCLEDEEKPDDDVTSEE